MGWNGSDLASTSRAASLRGSSRTPSPHSNGVRNGLIALVLIALAGAAAWWFLSTPMSQPTPVPEEEAEPSAVERRSLSADRVADDALSPKATSIGRVDSASSAAAEAVEPVEKPAPKKPRIPSEGDLPSVCDQVLAMISPESGGVDGPPLPNNAFSEKDFCEAMKREIKILPTDDRHTVALKESVIALRQELLQLLDEGMTVDEVLKKYREDQEHFAEIRRNLAIEIKEIQATGSETEAKEYRDIMNDCLRQMECPEVEIPVTKEELQAVEEQKELEQEELVHEYE